MKKSKLLIVALIGLMLATGMVLASCRAGCDGVGDCSVKDGKGSFCVTGTGSENGCAANKAAGTNGSGKCDC